MAQLKLWEAAYGWLRAKNQGIFQQSLRLMRVIDILLLGRAVSFVLFAGSIGISSEL